MKNALSLIGIFLMVIGIIQESYAQEWFNGVLYQPLPLPKVSDAPAQKDMGENQFLIHDATSGQTTPEPRNLTDQTFPSDATLGNPGSVSAMGSGALDRNFSTLSPMTQSGTTTYPARTTVKLFITFPNGGNYVGSGALIDGRFVLTVGHCVHDKNLGGWARSITVVPAYNYRYAPYGNATGVLFYSWSFWVNNKDLNWDLGMIKLSRNIGSLTGWLGFGYNTSNSFFSGKTFYNYSYPAASPYNGEQMFYQKGTFDQITNRVLYYKRTSYGGQSGSVMYDANKVVYAALSHGDNSRTGCIRLSPEMFNYFKNQMQSAIPRGVNIAPLAAKISDDQIFARSGDTRSVGVTIYNDSNVGFEGDVPIKVYLSQDDEIDATDQVVHLQTSHLRIPARSATFVVLDDVSIPSHIAEGGYKLGIWLDIEDAVKEDNKTNTQDNVSVAIRSLAPSLASDKPMEGISIYPNPVVNQAKISYALQNGAITSVRVVNTIGQAIGVLQEKQQMSKGTYDFTHDFTHLATGVYIIILSVGEEKYFCRFVKT